MPVDRIAFFDDRRLRTVRGFERVFLEAEKHSADPVLWPTELWEERRVYLFGSVLPEKAGYRMYYQTCSDHLEGPDKAMVCVADSEDLVTWCKPMIGTEPFRERRHTNIVLKCSGPAPLYSPSIIHDTGDMEASRRFKMLFWDSAVPGGKRGGNAAFSKDGLSWRRHGSELLFDEPNDVVVTVRFPDGEFICYQTLLKKDPSQSYRRDNLLGFRRIIGRRTSRNFFEWSKPEIVLEPDRRDPADTQFYGLAAGRCADLLVGLLWTYHAESQTSDVQLAWSVDGRSWRRPEERIPLVGLGPLGGFDSHLIFTASEPVTHNGKIHILYGGFDGPHDSRTRAGAIGLATLREDGWCCLAAGDEWCELVTTALPFSPKNLLLNLDADEGECKAEILDGKLSPLPGFRLDECFPIAGVDDLRAPLRWRGGEPPLLSAGKWSLRLRARRARLFSILSAPGGKE